MAHNDVSSTPFATTSIRISTTVSIRFTVAKWVAGELGMDDYFSEMLPGQKAEQIKEVQGRALTVAWSATA
jgi:high-affinity K+ transport system ATPase subunit B